MAIGDASGSNVDSINNLDAGNPLHVQNSDNSSSVLIPFKLQGTENYRIWNGAMKLALQARNKFGFVDGTCLKSAYATSNVLSAQWDRCNAMKELQETYDKVDGIVFASANDEADVVPKGLDDYYQPVRSALLTRDPLPDVKDAYNTVSREESHRGIPESSGTSDAKLNATSFVAKTFNNNRRNFNTNNNTRGPFPNNNNNRGPNPNLNCKNYGKIGHTIDRCYEIVGFPANFKRASNNNGKQSFNANVDVKCDKQNLGGPSSPSGFTPEQIKKLLNLINDNGAGNFHANMAGRYSFFNGIVWFNMNFSKFFCTNNKLNVKTISLGWIIDSGANQHLTVSTIGMINVVDVTSLNITVGHPNSTLATISHIGNHKLTDNVILYDVLVVPGYCVSLLSINKLIRDSKMFVGFDEEKCYIQDLTRHNILGTGSESGGLYLFDMPPKSSTSVGESNMIMSFNVSKILWYNRLGHPTDQVLATLHNYLKISKSSSVLVCEVCHRAKQTREPFPLSDHKSKNLGDLVHLHLWGPYRVTSREGYKYFLTIIDDFSRAIWVYLVKTKNENLLDVFMDEAFNGNRLLYLTNTRRNRFKVWFVKKQEGIAVLQGKRWRDFALDGNLEAIMLHFIQEGDDSFYVTGFKHAKFLPDLDEEDTIVVNVEDETYDVGVTRVLEWELIDSSINLT
ncbi:ribonuclease H-like domain-containing protein [Tanacetum coccineum]